MSLATLGAHATATERDICVPLLQRNVSENGLLPPRPDASSGGGGGGGDRSSGDSGGGWCEVRALDWQAPWALLPDSDNKSNGGTSSWSDYEMVVGADLAFPSNSDNFEALADVLLLALRGGAGSSSSSGSGSGSGSGSSSSSSSSGGWTPEGWLAHETRRPEVEQYFWDALRRRGIEALKMAAPGSSQGSSSSSIHHYHYYYPTELPRVAECSSPEIGIYRLSLSGKKAAPPAVATAAVTS